MAKLATKTNVGINAQRTIHETTILTRLEAYFGKPIKDLNDPIGNYVGGAGGADQALAGALNRYDGFHDDGLGLIPGDMQGLTTIGMVEVAIVMWYAQNNWNVIHRPMGG